MADTTKTGGRTGFRLDIQALGPILALIVLVVIGTILNPDFLAA